MSLVRDWKERHSGAGSTARLIWLVVILVFVILFMLKSEDIVRTFTNTFFPGEAGSSP
ncbi:hypothetical protein JW921_02685 [Candidatus Fermentibacterales bacterium]|nr:hypothetical protein [Candidatus Fermentibacterales bacterium]